jgi:ketosteroid isomerase-like protein
MADIVELMQAWLDTFGEGEFDAFPGKVSPDFILHLPFVPAGIPTEIRGREAVRERLSSTAKGRSKLIFHDVTILRTEDPELLVTTARGEATMASGKPYRNRYVMLTRIRGDEVIEHTEYLNPLAVMEAMGD